MGEDFEEWLISCLGYYNAIRLEDFITYVSGICLGVLIATIVYTYVITKMRRDRNLDPDIICFYVPEKQVYVFNPKTFKETLEVAFIVIYLMIFKRSQEVSLTFKDAKRLRRIFLICLIAALVFIFVGMYFTIKVTVLDDI